MAEIRWISRKETNSNRSRRQKYKNSPDRGLRSSPHLDPDLGWPWKSYRREWQQNVDECVPVSFMLKSLRNFPLCTSLIVWLINLDWSAICRPSGCTVASGVVGGVVVVVVLTLTLTSDDLESHIVVHDSSTSNIIPSFIEIGWSLLLANFVTR